ncbi:unnamed protein product [Pieris brassicae]|uniref:Uncharacterized protein n=1 Tax=Pieris brassicae TaxID=7116 RepID=A0A9P0TU18_PIEBR|nr:unnamed protein product [Pieris brassicae]
MSWPEGVRRGVRLRYRRVSALDVDDTVSCFCRFALFTLYYSFDMFTHSRGLIRFENYSIESYHRPRRSLRRAIVVQSPHRVLSPLRGLHLSDVTERTVRVPPPPAARPSDFKVLA